MDGWMDGRTDGWMDGWTDGRMDGWMDGWMDEWIADPGGPVVIILATGSEVSDFKPGRVEGFFESVKMLSITSFEREVKP